MKNQLHFIRHAILFLIVSFSPSLYAQEERGVAREQAKHFVEKLSIEEKVGQMTLVDYNAIKRNFADVQEYKIGAVLTGGSSNPGDNTPFDYKYLYDSLQKLALGTPHKIPILFGFDAVHGFSNARNTVVFPHNIGLGCANDVTLMKRIGHVTAVETRATGINWVYSPCLAVPQDERWGRTYEGYSEQTIIVKQLGGAYIEGLQGKELRSNESVLSCSKHFIGDGNTNEGKDRGNSLVSADYIKDSLLPIYDYAIRKNTGSIMASFSSINGKKCHGSRSLLHETLREQLGFEGFLVSDWEAIDLLDGDYYSDVVISINAGIDMVMVPNRYKVFIKTILKAIENGDIKEERINEAVERIITKKIELGLFDNPFVDKLQMSKIRSKEHKEVAREAVRKSLVLLENNGILPLKKNAKNIFVAGRHADNLGYQCGGWTLKWQGVSGNKTIGTTVLGALRKSMPNTTIRFVENGQGAENSDAAIVVIGEEPYAEWMGDNKKLQFKKEDIATLKNVKKSGVPVVCILIVGRPLILESILPYCDALVCAWLPGTEGEGITDVLFGDYLPQGKLSYTWPKSVDQIPINIGDENYSPLYPFAYGKQSFDVDDELTILSASLDAERKNVRLNFNQEIRNSVSASNFSVTDDKGNSFDVVNVENFEKSHELNLSLSKSIGVDSRAYVSIKNNTIESIGGNVMGEIERMDIYNPINIEKISNVPGMIQAESFYEQKNTDLEDCWDDNGGQAVIMEAGEYLYFSVDIDVEGTYDLIYRAKGLSPSLVSIFIDEQEIAQIKVPLSRSGKWKSYKQRKVSLSKGVHSVKVEVVEGISSMNWLSFDSFRVYKRTDAIKK